MSVAGLPGRTNFSKMSKQQILQEYKSDIEALKHPAVPSADKVALLHKICELVSTVSNYAIRDFRSGGVRALVSLAADEWPAAGNLAKSASAYDLSVRVGFSPAFHTIRRVAIGALALLINKSLDNLLEAKQAGFFKYVEQMLFDTGHRYRCAQSYSKYYGDYDGPTTCQSQFIYERLVSILTHACIAACSCDEYGSETLAIQDTCARVVLANFKLEPYYAIREQLSKALTPEEVIHANKGHDKNLVIKDPFPDTLLAFLKQLACCSPEAALSKHVDYGVINVLQGFRPFMYFEARYRHDLDRLQDKYHTVHIKGVKHKVKQVMEQTARAAQKSTRLKDDGNYEYSREKYDVAVGFYHQALQQDCWNLAAMGNLSLCFLKMEQYERALDSAVAAIVMDPDRPKSWGRLAEACLGSKLFDAAFVAATQAHTLEPSPQFRGMQQQARSGLASLLQSLSPAAQPKAPGDPAPSKSKKKKKKAKAKQAANSESDEHSAACGTRNNSAPGTGTGAMNRTLVWLGNGAAGSTPWDCLQRELHKAGSISSATHNMNAATNTATSATNAANYAANVNSCTANTARNAFKGDNSAEGKLGSAAGSTACGDSAVVRNGVTPVVQLPLALPGQLQDLLGLEAPPPAKLTKMYSKQLIKWPLHGWLAQCTWGYVPDLAVLPAVCRFSDTVAVHEGLEGAKQVLQQACQRANGIWQGAAWTNGRADLAVDNSKLEQHLTQQLLAGSLVQLLLELRCLSGLTSSVVSTLPVLDETWKVSFSSTDRFEHPTDHCLFLVYVCYDTFMLERGHAMPVLSQGLPSHNVVVRALYATMVERGFRPRNVMVAYRLAYCYEAVHNALVQADVGVLMECFQGATSGAARMSQGGVPWLPFLGKDVFGLNCKRAQGRYMSFMI